MYVAMDHHVPVLRSSSIADAPSRKHMPKFSGSVAAAAAASPVGDEAGREEKVSNVTDRTAIMFYTPPSALGRSPTPASAATAMERQLLQPESHGTQNNHNHISSSKRTFPATPAVAATATTLANADTLTSSAAALFGPSFSFLPNPGGRSSSSSSTFFHPHTSTAQSLTITATGAGAGDEDSPLCTRKHFAALRSSFKDDPARGFFLSSPPHAQGGMRSCGGASSSNGRGGGNAAAATAAAIATASATSAIGINRSFFPKPSLGRIELPTGDVASGVVVVPASTGSRLGTANSSRSASGARVGSAMVSRVSSKQIAGSSGGGAAGSSTARVSSASVLPSSQYLALHGVSSGISATTGSSGGLSATTSPSTRLGSGSSRLIQSAGTGCGSSNSRLINGNGAAAATSPSPSSPRSESRGRNIASAHVLRRSGTSHEGRPGESVSGAQLRRAKATHSYYAARKELEEIAAAQEEKQRQLEQVKEQQRLRELREEEEERQQKMKRRRTPSKRGDTCTSLSAPSVTMAASSSAGSGSVAGCDGGDRNVLSFLDDNSHIGGDITTFGSCEAKCDSGSSYYQLGSSGSQRDVTAAASTQGSTLPVDTSAASMTTTPPLHVPRHLVAKSRTKDSKDVSQQQQQQDSRNTAFTSPLSTSSLLEGEQLLQLQQCPQSLSKRVKQVFCSSASASFLTGSTVTSALHCSDGHLTHQHQQAPAERSHSLVAPLSSQGVAMQGSKGLPDAVSVATFPAEYEDDYAESHGLHRHYRTREGGGDKVKKRRGDDDCDASSNAGAASAATTAAAAKKFDCATMPTSAFSIGTAAARVTHPPLPCPSSMKFKPKHEAGSGSAPFLSSVDERDGCCAGEAGVRAVRREHEIEAREAEAVCEAAEKERIAEERAGLLRQGIRAFERTYNRNRELIENTPNLDAMMKEVAKGYFKKHEEALANEYGLMTETPGVVKVRPGAHAVLFSASSEDDECDTSSADSTAAIAKPKNIQGAAKISKKRLRLSDGNDTKADRGNENVTSEEEETTPARKTHARRGAVQKHNDALERHLNVALGKLEKAHMASDGYSVERSSPASPSLTGRGGGGAAGSGRATNMCSSTAGNQGFQRQKHQNQAMLPATNSQAASPELLNASSPPLVAVAPTPNSPHNGSSVLSSTGTFAGPFANSFTFNKRTSDTPVFTVPSAGSCSNPHGDASSAPLQRQDETPLEVPWQSIPCHPQASALNNLALAAANPVVTTTGSSSTTSRLIGSGNSFPSTIPLATSRSQPFADSQTLSRTTAMLQQQQQHHMSGTFTTMATVTSDGTNTSQGQSPGASRASTRALTMGLSSCIEEEEEEVREGKCGNVTSAAAKTNTGNASPQIEGQRQMKHVAVVDGDITAATTTVAEEGEDKRPTSSARKGYKRVALPERLSQALRNHEPLYKCVRCAARLVVFSLMRSLPGMLYEGDSVEFAKLREEEKVLITRALQWELRRQEEAQAAAAHAAALAAQAEARRQAYQQQQQQQQPQRGSWIQRMPMPAGNVQGRTVDGASDPQMQRQQKATAQEKAAPREVEQEDSVKFSKISPAFLTQLTLEPAVEDGSREKHVGNENGNYYRFFHAVATIGDCGPDPADTRGVGDPDAGGEARSSDPHHHREAEMVEEGKGGDATKGSASTRYYGTCSSQHTGILVNKRVSFGDDKFNDDDDSDEHDDSHTSDSSGTSNVMSPRVRRPDTLTCTPDMVIAEGGLTEHQAELLNTLHHSSPLAAYRRRYQFESASPRTIKNTHQGQKGPVITSGTGGSRVCEDNDTEVPAGDNEGGSSDVLADRKRFSRSTASATARFAFALSGTTNGGGGTANSFGKRRVPLHAFPVETLALAETKSARRALGSPLSYSYNTSGAAVGWGSSRAVDGGGGGGGGGEKNGATVSGEKFSPRVCIIDEAFSSVASLLTRSRAVTIECLLTLLCGSGEELREEEEEEEDSGSGSRRCMSPQQLLRALPPSSSSSSAGLISAGGRSSPWEVTSSAPPLELLQLLQQAIHNGGHLSRRGRERALALLRREQRTHAVSQQLHPLRHNSKANKNQQSQPSVSQLSTKGRVMMLLASAVQESELPPQVDEYGRPSSVCPLLIQSHGGYGVAPFSGAVFRYLLEHRELTEYLTNMPSTGDDPVAVAEAAAAAAAHTAVAHGRSSGARGETGGGGATASAAGFSTHPSPADAATYSSSALLIQRLMEPEPSLLPLLALSKIMRTSTQHNAIIPFHQAELLLGPTELYLLLDFMEAFAELSFSFSESTHSLHPTKLDSEDEDDNDGNAGSAGRSSTKGQQTDKKKKSAAGSDVGAYFFQIHREALLEWSCVAICEASIGYAMELAGPGPGGFSLVSYESTFNITDEQADAVLDSPLPALSLPNVPFSRHNRQVARSVLEKNRSVVLESIVRLKGEMYYLLTGIDQRHTLLEMHRKLLEDVKRGVFKEQQENRLISRHQIFTTTVDAAAGDAMRQVSSASDSRRSCYRSQSSNDSGAGAAVAVPAIRRRSTRLRGAAAPAAAATVGGAAATEAIADGEAVLSLADAVEQASKGLGRTPLQEVFLSLPVRPREEVEGGEKEGRWLLSKIGAAMTTTTTTSTEAPAPEAAASLMKSMPFFPALSTVVSHSETTSLAAAAAAAMPPRGEEWPSGASLGATITTTTTATALSTSGRAVQQMSPRHNAVDDQQGDLSASRGRTTLEQKPSTFNSSASSNSGAHKLSSSRRKVLLQDGACRHHQEEEERALAQREAQRRLPADLAVHTLLREMQDLEDCRVISNRTNALLTGSLYESGCTWTTSAMNGHAEEKKKGLQVHAHMISTRKADVASGVAASGGLEEEAFSAIPRDYSGESGAGGGTSALPKTTQYLQQILKPVYVHVPTTLPQFEFGLSSQYRTPRTVSAGGEGNGIGGMDVSSTCTAQQLQQQQQSMCIPRKPRQPASLNIKVTHCPQRLIDKYSVFVLDDGAEPEDSDDEEEGDRSRNSTQYNAVSHDGEEDEDDDDDDDHDGMYELILGSNEAEHAELADRARRISEWISRRPDIQQGPSVTAAYPEATRITASRSGSAKRQSGGGAKKGGGTDANSARSPRQRRPRKLPWYTHGCPTFERRRLEAKLCRPRPAGAFDLNTISPLIALSACIDTTIHFIDASTVSEAGKAVAALSSPRTASKAASEKRELTVAVRSSPAAAAANLPAGSSRFLQSDIPRQQRQRGDATSSAVVCGPDHFQSVWPRHPCAPGTVADAAIAGAAAAATSFSSSMKKENLGTAIPKQQQLHVKTKKEEKSVPHTHAIQLTNPYSIQDRFALATARVSTIAEAKASTAVYTTPSRAASRCQREGSQARPLSPPQKLPVTSPISLTAGTAARAVNSGSSCSSAHHSSSSRRVRNSQDSAVKRNTKRTSPRTPLRSSSLQRTGRINNAVLFAKEANKTVSGPRSTASTATTTTTVTTHASGTLGVTSRTTTAANAPVDAKPKAERISLRERGLRMGQHLMPWTL